MLVGKRGLVMLSIILISLVILMLNQATTTTTNFFVRAGGLDENSKSNRMGGLTPSALISNTLTTNKDNAVAFSSTSSSVGIIQADHENEMEQTTITAATTTATTTTTLVNYGSVLSDEESFGALEKSGQLLSSTAGNSEEISSLLGSLLENEESNLVESAIEGNEEEIEEEAVASSEGVSSEENDEMMENLSNEESDAEIEEAASNTNEGFSLDESLDSSGVSTLSTKSEQQLTHKKFLTRSHKHAKKNNFNCNPLCMARQGFVALTKKVSKTRTLVKLFRKKRSTINRTLYKMQQILVKARKTLEESKSEDFKAQAQHSKTKAERTVERLQKVKKINNDKIKRTHASLKKLKLKKSKAYLRLKKMLNKNILTLLKRYQISLNRKANAVKIYKAQKEKFGKKKFVAPYLVNFAKLDVLIAQKKYSNALYFNMRRQIFVLNHLLTHRRKVLKLLSYETSRAKLFSLKTQDEKKKIEKAEKQLESDKINETIKSNIKGSIEIGKLKLAQYKKHIATCNIITKKAKTALGNIAKKLKEAASVLSTKKVNIPSGLSKILQQKFNAKQTKIDKMKALNEAAVNKNEMKAALPKNPDYNSKTYIRLALKKNQTPFLCTTNDQPNRKEKIAGQSINSDLLFKPLICYHKTKVHVKVTYTIGQNTMLISKHHAKWVRYNVRLVLNKKGHLVVQKKGAKTMKKPAFPSFTKKSIFADRVKYIEAHPSTSRAVIKSYVMKYHKLPNGTFGLVFAINRGAVAKKPVIQKRK